MFENCEQIQENLLFHLNGEEDESSDLIIRNHLENCPTCRKKRESLAILEGLLSNLPRKALVGDELGQDYVAPLLLSLPEKEAPSKVMSPSPNSALLKFTRPLPKSTALKSTLQYPLMLNDFQHLMESSLRC